MSESASGIPCAVCATTNPAGHRFCGGCGAPLQRACPSCGTPVSSVDQRFCGSCGGALDAAVAPAAPATPGPGPTELRWVSVLFVDLVGWTTLAEATDAEDARALLSGYYDLARTIVTRYGGTVEKFVGDAVMAVWGSRVAREDDSERSVRAALDVVAEIPAFGDAQGVTLQARAGVVTGQVAAVDNPDEGIVVGDRVNTAARVQSVAPPGGVLVDEITRRATEAAIAYGEATSYELKGKDGSLPLYLATRVIAGAGGRSRVDGLEARFIGRARELALVKELFHATLEDRRARMLLVTGPAGIGKSRLRWEFDKYSDGLADTVFWHNGRCLSYGDGVSYWALAEMVRNRLGLAEDDPPAVITARIDELLPTWVPDGTERAFVAERLGVLLGSSAAELSREELFAGWRLFFERLSDTNPVVLVIEDLQWADAGLLDFLDHLLDYSATLPIFVLAMARPELADRRPEWLAGRRNVTTVHLEPLPPAVMTELVDELVPDMPSSATERIVARAEGVPLFAVETIRSLVDRDVVVAQGGLYRLVGEIGELDDVPAGLTALIASRLDGLEPQERALVKDLAVLGGSFPRDAVAAITTLPADETDTVLRSLVRKEIVTVRSDPLDKTRGHYAFVQTLLRTVAYDSLSKGERHAKHVAVARHLRETFPDGGEDIAEVVAAHLHQAYLADPSAPDSEQVRTEALAALEQAARRAAAVGAPESAELSYRTAASLAPDEDSAVRLLERAGDMALGSGRPSDALLLFEQVRAHRLAAGEHVDAALLAARTAQCMLASARFDEGIALLMEALHVLEPTGHQDEVAKLHTSLAWHHVWAGHDAEAVAHMESALSMGAALDLPEVLGVAALSKGVHLSHHGRLSEAVAVTDWALDLLTAADLTSDAVRAHINLGDMRAQSDHPGAEEAARAGLALCRRVGNRRTEAMLLANLAGVHVYTGDWEAALHETAQALEVDPDGSSAWVNVRGLLIAMLRGDADAARAHAHELAPLADSDDLQDIPLGGVAAAFLTNLDGGNDRDDRTWPALTGAVRTALERGLFTDTSRAVWTAAVVMAEQAGQHGVLAELAELALARPQGHVPRFVRAEAVRCQALAGRATGADPAASAEQLRESLAILAELDYPYWRAKTELQLARCALDLGDASSARTLVEQARPVFERLGAEPALRECAGVLSHSALSAQA